MRPTSLTSLACLALSCSAIASVAARQNEPVVPVHQEPRHRLVFDSQDTKILDVQIPPGDTTLFHTHSDAILYVTMSTSQTRSQNHGAEWSAAAPTIAVAPVTVAAAKVAPSNPPGRLMSTTSYAAKPQTHRVNNIGASLFRLIGITNSSPGDDNAAPATDFEGTAELSNRWFRGYRVSLTSTPTAEHRHVNPVALVVVDGRAVANVTTSAKTLNLPGEFAFVEPNIPHRLHAVDGSATVVEVEIRRAH